MYFVANLSIIFNTGLWHIILAPLQRFILGLLKTTNKIPEAFNIPSFSFHEQQQLYHADCNCYCRDRRMKLNTLLRCVIF